MNRGERRRIYSELVSAHQLGRHSIALAIGECADYVMEAGVVQFRAGNDEAAKALRATSERVRRLRDAATIFEEKAGAQRKPYDARPPRNPST